MIETTCHCGNIAITTNKLPESVTTCNCSLCYRIAALWAYYTANQVVNIRYFDGANTFKYVEQ
ncbi:hypothetical protein Q4585_14555 [Colwellia sp. 2_MG-2023]|nr:hypothetical protein [Colwellia sp. 2_MG-2023]